MGEPEPLFWARLSLHHALAPRAPFDLIPPVRATAAPRTISPSQSMAPGVCFLIQEDPPMPTTLESSEEIKRRIGELNLEHRDLDRAIEALELNPLHDELQLKRLKKRKLMLKDQIFMLQRQLVPDIPA
jgi:hypothetical protein